MQLLPGQQACPGCPHASQALPAPDEGHTVLPPEHIVSGETHFCVPGSQHPYEHAVPDEQHDSPGFPQLVPPDDDDVTVHDPADCAAAVQLALAAALVAFWSVVPADVHFQLDDTQFTMPWYDGHCLRKVSQLEVSFDLKLAGSFGHARLEHEALLVFEHARSVTTPMTAAAHAEPTAARIDCVRFIA